MQKCGKILRGRKDTLAPVVSTVRGRAPPSPPPFRRLCSECYAGLARAALITSRHRIYNNKFGLVLSMIWRKLCGAAPWWVAEMSHPNLMSYTVLSFCHMSSYGVPRYTTGWELPGEGFDPSSLCQPPLIFFSILLGGQQNPPQFFKFTSSILSLSRVSQCIMINYK